MAIERKETKKYVFTVEGETEHWYFDWLQNEINSREKSLYNVTIISEVQQSPRKYAKKVNPLATPIITHINILAFLSLSCSFINSCNVPSFRIMTEVLTPLSLI